MVVLVKTVAWLDILKDLYLRCGHGHDNDDIINDDDHKTNDVYIQINTLQQNVHDM